MLRLRHTFPSPVRIASLEVLRCGTRHFVRIVSSDGAEGIALADDRAAGSLPQVKDRIAPMFLGKDACDIEALMATVPDDPAAGSRPAVAAVEAAVLDLLGKAAGKPVGQLLGRVLREGIAVYLSSAGRERSPEDEVVRLGERLAQTEAGAVKLKIGGANAAPGRTERLVRLARQAFSDKIAIYADADGSYDDAEAVKIGRMLETQDVFFFEDPCPCEDIEATQRVADTLAIAVAGGSRVSSPAQFEELIRRRVMDIAQPYIAGLGGLIPSLRVARAAERAGMALALHNPTPGPCSAPSLHFASIVRNIAPFQQYALEPIEDESWYTPSFQVKDGDVKIPEGPGLGVTYDPDLLRKAEKQ